MFLYRKTLTIPSKFVLYGERHSGTKFFEQVIRSTYGLPLNNNYGQKHFFGFANHKEISVDEKTIFFCIIRNPYHWIAAMSSMPHHIPHHLLPLYDHYLMNGIAYLNTGKYGIISQLRLLIMKLWKIDIYLLIGDILVF